MKKATLAILLLTLMSCESVEESVEQLEPLSLNDIIPSNFYIIQKTDRILLEFYNSNAVTTFLLTDESCTSGTLLNSFQYRISEDGLTLQLRSGTNGTSDRLRSTQIEINDKDQNT